MSDLSNSHEEEDDRIAGWLFAILRFAITAQNADRSSVLAMARDMDRLKGDADARGFAFFSKTSSEICAAIACEQNPERAAILRRHFSRIGNARLRAALETASGLVDCDTSATPEPKRERLHLWKGL